MLQWCKAPGLRLASARQAMDQGLCHLQSRSRGYQYVNGWAYLLFSIMSGHIRPAKQKTGIAGTIIQPRCTIYLLVHQGTQVSGAPSRRHQKLPRMHLVQQSSCRRGCLAPSSFWAVIVKTEWILRSISAFSWVWSNCCALRAQALKDEYIIEKFFLLKYFLNPMTKEFNQKVIPFSGIVLP